MKGSVPNQVIRAIWDKRRDTRPKWYKRKKWVTWWFYCPLNSSRYCQRKVLNLWWNKNKVFGCEWCAKIRMAERIIKDHIRDYLKDPELVVRVLKDPFQSEEDKVWAYLALEYFTKRFKRMTDGYGNLNESKRRKYEVYRRILFPPKGSEIGYKPSKLKYQIPAPLQKVLDRFKGV